LGEAPGRCAELSQSVSRLRHEIAEKLDESGTDLSLCSPESETPRSETSETSETKITDLSLCHSSALEFLTNEVGLTQPAAQQIVEYLAMTKLALGVMPTQEEIV